MGEATVCANLNKFELKKTPWQDCKIMYALLCTVKLYLQLSSYTGLKKNKKKKHQDKRKKTPESISQTSVLLYLFTQCGFLFCAAVSHTEASQIKGKSVKAPNEICLTVREKKKKTHSPGKETNLNLQIHEVEY